MGVHVRKQNVQNKTRRSINNFERVIMEKIDICIYCKPCTYIKDTRKMMFIPYHRRKYYRYTNCNCTTSDKANAQKPTTNLDTIVLIICIIFCLVILRTHH